MQHSRGGPPETIRTSSEGVQIMRARLHFFVGTIVTLAMVSSAAAQSIGQRVEHQQERIDQGLAARQLTAAQAQQLRSLEMRLQRVEADMRWQYGGDLSQRQRRTLQQMADQNSAAIHRLKHQRGTD